MRANTQQLKEWSFAWVWPFSRGLTLDEELWAVNKHIELQHYIFETMQRKRANPQNDIITRLTQIEVEDVDLGRKRPLTDKEIIGITDHLLIGGNDALGLTLEAAACVNGAGGPKLTPAAPSVALALRRPKPPKLTSCGPRTQRKAARLRR